MAEPRPEDNKDGPATIAGCLLTLVSLAVIVGVAVPVVMWRDPDTGRPMPKMVAIIVPVMAGALCHAIGAAILRILGISLQVNPEKESTDCPEEFGKSDGDSQIQG